MGERTLSVRAVAQDVAPRTVPVRIRRVASLSAEVKRLRGHALSTYAALTGQPQDSHPDVVLAGSVVEARPQRHTTVVLLDITAGCSRRPCLARVVHGSTVMLRSEEPITVGGQLLGQVDGPRQGSRIPEVHADFIVRAAP